MSHIFLAVKTHIRYLGSCSIVCASAEWRRSIPGGCLSGAPSGAQAVVGGPIRGLRFAKARLPPAIILRPSGTTAANRLVRCLNSPPSPLGTCPSLGAEKPSSGQAAEFNGSGALPWAGVWLRLRGGRKAPLVIFRNRP